MNTFRLPGRRIGTLALLTLPLLLACEDSAKINAPEPNSWQAPIITVQEQTLNEEYTTIGSVVADRSINISSRISSYISQLTVREGETISAGQLLVVLDDEELTNNINQARAAVEAAQALLEDVSGDLIRFNKLLQQGSISEVKVRKTKLQKSTAEESLNGAKAALSQAEAQRQYIHIRSPADGIVTNRHLEVGSLATPGMPILTIESRDKLKFETFAAESQLNNIKINDTVALDVDNIARPLVGRVAQIIYAGDPVSRRYKISIALPASADLYTGMFGRATFLVGQDENLTIPPSALIDKGGLQGVYVVDEESKARFRWLRIRRTWPDKIEIAAGLNPGEKIITAVPGDLREGDLIQIQDLNPPGVSGTVTAQDLAQ